MAFTEDLSAFINPDTPGYKVAQILGGSVEGIFSNDFALGNVGIGFESSDPEFTCRDIDIELVEHQETVTIDSVEYKVAEINPDGTGLSVLRLKT